MLLVAPESGSLRKAVPCAPACSLLVAAMACGSGFWAGCLELTDCSLPSLRSGGK